jgi:aminopeptidase N
VSRQVPPGTRADSLRLMRRTPRVVSWLETQLGRYPFDSTGGLTTSLSPGFSLETQTRPTYPVLAGDARLTVVHELAHQWFGDSVAVHGWRDVWLNEGAATFMEARYAETHGGRSAQAWLDSGYDAQPPGASFWHLEVADPGPGHLFDRAVYQRGGMTLQALRHRIGDADFWSLLRRWLSVGAGGTGSTPQFEAMAEQVSGVDLDGFFHDWLHTTTKPPRTEDNGLVAPARRSGGR